MRRYERRARPCWRASSRSNPRGPAPPGSSGLRCWAAPAHSHHGTCCRLFGSGRWPWARTACPKHRRRELLVGQPAHPRPRKRVWATTRATTCWFASSNFCAEPTPRRPKRCAHWEWWWRGDARIRPRLIVAPAPSRLRSGRCHERAGGRSLSPRRARRACARLSRDAPCGGNAHAQRRRVCVATQARVSLAGSRPDIFFLCFFFLEGGRQARSAFSRAPAPASCTVLGPAGAPMYSSHGNSAT